MDEHDGRNIIAVCLCTSWLDKLSLSLLSVPAAALAAQECCCCRRLSVRQLVGQVIVITVHPCTSWVPESSSSVPAAALAAQECRCRLSVRQLVGQVVVVTVCPLPESSSSLLSSVPAAALAAQQRRRRHCLSVCQLVGQVVVLTCLVARRCHRHPHLSLQQPKSSLSSVLWLIVTVCRITVPSPSPSPSIPVPATQVIAVVTAVYPVAHCWHLPMVRVVITVCPSGSLSSLLL